MIRVAITGMGVRCSIGRDLQEFESGLRAGRIGGSEVPSDRFDTSDPVYRTRCAGVLLGAPVESFRITDDTLLTDFAAATARDALADSGLDVARLPPTAIGVSLGTTVGGSHAFIKYVRGALGLPGGDITAVLRPCTAGSVGGGVAKLLGIQGPISVISTACAAGANSVGRAFDLVRRGRVQYMLAGGVDLFSELTFSGFNSIQALSRSQCKPFDQGRDGMMLGDAGAFLVLESLEDARNRAARIYAEVAGYGIANEAYHATGPDPNGDGALLVMQEALTQAGLRATDVDYINAHGTGTEANDAMEIKAIQRLLHERTGEVYISSTKSMTGHTLGAAGSLELAASALAIYAGFIPPTVNLQTPMAECEGFHFVRDRAINVQPKVALSNSFGFGGNVAAVVIRQP